MENEEMARAEEAEEAAEPGGEGMGAELAAHDPVADLANTIMIMKLMSAAEEAHARLLDQKAKQTRQLALLVTRAFFRVIAARTRPGTPLWLNLTMRAHETFIGGYIGFFTGVSDIPDDATVEFVRFSVDSAPHAVKPTSTPLDESWSTATQDTEWTEAIRLPNSPATGTGSNRPPH